MNALYQWMVDPSFADPVVVEADNWLSAAGIGLARLGVTGTRDCTVEHHADDSAVLRELATGREVVVWKGPPAHHR